MEYVFDRKELTLSRHVDGLSRVCLAVSVRVNALLFPFLSGHISAQRDVLIASLADLSGTCPSWIHRIKVRQSLCQLRRPRAGRRLAVISDHAARRPTSGLLTRTWVASTDKDLYQTARFTRPGCPTGAGPSDHPAFGLFVAPDRHRTQTRATSHGAQLMRRLLGLEEALRV